MKAIRNVIKNCNGLKNHFLEQPHIQNLTLFNMMGQGDEIVSIMYLCVKFFIIPKFQMLNTKNG
jgi:hypothetical protein